MMVPGPWIDSQVQALSSTPHRCSSRTSPKAGLDTGRQVIPIHTHLRAGISHRACTGDSSVPQDCPDVGMLMAKDSGSNLLGVSK